MGRGTGGSTVKLYYRIGEVAGIVGVEPHVLRYWETEFPTIRPQKSRSGQRVYSRRDVDKLLRVKELLYAQRFTIAGARQRLRESVSESSVVTNEVEVSGAANPAPETVSAVAQGPVPDGRSSAAQALRTTLLGVRGDVSRMLEALNNRAKSSPASESQCSDDNTDADVCDALASRSIVARDESTVPAITEAVRGGGYPAVAKGEG